MAQNKFLGDLEQMVLLAILRLGDEAWTGPIRDELHQRAGREISLGALYTTLDRLERKGCLSSALGDPRPAPGGRARRHWVVSEAGLRQLETSRRAYLELWSGLESVLERGR